MDSTNQKAKLLTLPNIITLANLLCGALGVVSMVSLPSDGALRTAFVLMLAAALFDFLDGFVARLTRQYSPLGAQLDSLADMVSFVLLPMLVAMKVYYLAGGHGTWSAVMFLLPVCGALRLARFNVSDDHQGDFVGLPVPACALLIGAAGWYAAGRMGVPAAGWVQWGVLVAGVALALLMVSAVRMFSLKFAGFRFAGNEVRYLYLLLSLAIVAVAGLPGIGLAVALYILYSLALTLLRGRK